MLSDASTLRGDQTNQKAMDEQPRGNPDLLRELMHYQMPYGKHKDQLIRNLPMYYLEWFARKGFPAGKLGTLLQTMHDIKLNGLEHLLNGLKATDRQ